MNNNEAQIADDKQHDADKNSVKWSKLRPIFQNASLGN
jgi:hypothetical protein